MVLDSQVLLFEEAARSSLLSDMFSIQLDAEVQLEGKQGAPVPLWCPGSLLCLLRVTDADEEMDQM